MIVDNDYRIILFSELFVQAQVQPIITIPIPNLPDYMLAHDYVGLQLSTQISIVSSSYSVCNWVVNHNGGSSRPQLFYSRILTPLWLSTMVYKLYERQWFDIHHLKNKQSTWSWCVECGGAMLCYSWFWNIGWNVSIEINVKGLWN